MRRGILMRSEEEIELYRIKDIKVHFSLVQQFFGNGDLSVISSDATGVNVLGRHCVVQPESIMANRPAIPFTNGWSMAHAPCSTSQTRRTISPTASPKRPDVFKISFLV